MALRLILEIAGGPELEIGDSRRKVFEGEGGRIGRALDCEWVLSNGYVSRHHATVSCIDGVFYIESVGANGVAVNSSDARLSRHQRRALKHGDRLFLDEYEIQVSITDVDTSAPALDYKVPPEEDVLANLAPVPAPPTLQAAPAAYFDAAAFFQGLGVEPQPLDAAAATLIGQILRVSLQGLLDVEQARLQVDTQLRASDDTVEIASLNSPLKVATRVEEAILALLGPPQPGQLPPLKAVEDALGDIRFHQLSMLAGMRASFDSFTHRFEPGRLIELANYGRHKSLTGLAAKARYWDKYLELFEEVMLHPEEGLQNAYREVFFDTYERQLADLKRTQPQQAAA